MREESMADSKESEVLVIANGDSGVARLSILELVSMSTEGVRRELCAR